MRRRSREFSTQMAAQILKHERAEELHFKNLTVRNYKPLELNRALPPD